MSESVALFVTCLVENMRPKVGFDTIALLEDAGFSVVVPVNQVCCGQPNYNGGDRAGAIKTARFVIDSFLPYQYTIVPSGSCAGMLKHHYPQLLEDDNEYAEKSRQLADQVFEISQFLVRAGYQPRPSMPSEATYHDACAGLRELGISSEPRQLMAGAGVKLQELAETDSCCGFGGTFCVKYPDISGAMVDRKIQDIQSTETNLVVMGDLGCLLNIEGRLARTKQQINAKHLVEVLAEGLNASSKDDFEAHDNDAEHKP